MSKLKVYKIESRAKLPVYSTESAACFDLFALIAPSQYSSGVVHISPGKKALIPTGLIFDIPEGYSVRLHPRSGLALKHGITLLNAEGVIDSDYTDIVCAILYNAGEEVYAISDGDKICQGELVKDIRVDFEEIERAPEKKGNRNGGFGSTGV